VNWVDLLILILILVPAIVGFRNGLLRKLFGFAGIIVGFILAVKLYKPISEFISPLIINVRPAVALLISFLTVLLLTYGLFLYLAKYMSNLHPTTNTLNKIFGIAAGALQGLIIASIVLYNLNQIGFPSEKTKNGSLFYKNVINIAPFIIDKLVRLLPDNNETFNEFNGNEQPKDSNNRRR
jgi:membrane protein required for colicin V production